jgi:hypothetical protein
VSDYGLDDRAIGVRCPARAKDFSSILCVQTTLFVVLFVKVLVCGGQVCVLNVTRCRSTVLMSTLFPHAVQI